MVKRRMTIMIMLVAVTAVMVSGCHRTPEQRAECMVKHIAAELKLDDTQKARMEKIKDEFLAKRPEMSKLREETVKEANELMKSTEIDKARLNALLERNKAFANDMIGFVAAKFTEIHDMLTPEQRDKLVNMIEKHHRERSKTE
jgi:periplasmic protein CpxP/Spy